MKRKAELTSDRDGAQKDKEIGRGPQRKAENGPQKGVEASEIAWVHLNPSGDNSISLSGSVMESSTASSGHAAQEPVQLKQNSPQSLSGPVCRGLQLKKSSAPTEPQRLSYEMLNYSAQAIRPKSQFSSGRIAHKASAAQFAGLFSSGRP